MADTSFTNATSTVPGTLVVASWLNDVNTNTYTILNSVAGTNTITATGASTVTVGYPRGVAFRFLPINTNTGPATINISGLGVKNLTKFGTTPLAAGDLLAGAWAYITYDGTQFQLVNASGPFAGTDTYITTAGSTTAYTLTFGGSFALFSGNAVKMVFNATNTSTTPTLNVNGTGAIAMKVMDTNGNKVDPIVGAFAQNTPATAIYDGVNWVTVVEYPSGRLLNVQVLTTSGNYTPTPGTASIIAELVGGAGGTAGAPATGAGQWSFGQAGGAAGMVKHRATTGFSGAAYVIGAGGTAGAAGGVGGTGGNTTFLGCIAGGGGPGAPIGAAAQSGTGAAAVGTASGGNIWNTNGPGGAGHNWSQPANMGGATPIVPSTQYGSGPAPIGLGSAAVAGQGFGVGGSWAAQLVSAGALVGVAGRPGVIYVYEYS